jgi:hypothetical protein
MANFEKNKWIMIGKEIDMSSAGCKKRAKECNFTFS